MHESTDRAPLKVLNAELAGRLAAFNGTARQLRAMGVEVLESNFIEHRLVINHDAAALVAERFPMDGFSRASSAGSTRYRMLLNGVTLEWREPISASRPSEWRLH